MKNCIRISAISDLNQNVKKTTKIGQWSSKTVFIVAAAIIQHSPYHHSFHSHPSVNLLNILTITYKLHCVIIIAIILCLLMFSIPSLDFGHENFIFYQCYR